MSIFNSITHNTVLALRGVATIMSSIKIHEALSIINYLIHSLVLCGEERITSTASLKNVSSIKIHEALSIFHFLINHNLV